MIGEAIIRSKTLNIFVLDEDVELAAQYHVDRHIVKMPLETAQMLCTTLHLSGYSSEIPYRATHANHPCSIWTRKTISNYMWLVDFGLALCREYTHRYDKTHKCQSIIEWCHKNVPDLPSEGLTRFAEAMPDQYKKENPVYSYRNYYVDAKQHLFSWKKREEPWWIDTQLAQFSAF
jgi:hypothetical protein